MGNRKFAIVANEKGKKQASKQEAILFNDGRQR